MSLSPATKQMDIVKTRSKAKNALASRDTTAMAQPVVFIHIQLKKRS